MEVAPLALHGLLEVVVARRVPRMTRVLSAVARDAGIYRILSSAAFWLFSAV